MASGQTQYYGLSQWEAADKVERVDFNTDNVKVDEALHGLAEQVGQKADKSTVTNLSSVVGQKADKTALTAAEGRVSALESGKADKSELTAQVNTLSQSHAADTAALRGENCWVKLGTWTLEAGAVGANLDLPQISKTAYRQLRLHFHIGMAEEADALIIQMDHITGSRYQVSGTSSGTGIYLCHRSARFAAGTLDLFPVPGCPDLLAGVVQGIGDLVPSTYSRPFTVKDTCWDDLSSIQLGLNGTMLAAGSEFALYGLKS